MSDTLSSPIFVLGSPRSGTTMLGSWLGSHPDICALGEYSAFVFANYTAPSGYTRTRPEYSDRYLRELQEHAAGFAQKYAREAGAQYFCDSTPWNLLVVDALADQFPDARFVLTVRHYMGVVQSLARSYVKRYLWAGATPEERAWLWANIYGGVVRLPADRTVVVSYDALCADPVNAISAWRRDLAAIGLNVEALDDSVFTRSYATDDDSTRMTIATGNRDEVEFRPIPSARPQEWSPKIEQEVWPVVRETHELLRERFSCYRGPSLPTSF